MNGSRRLLVLASTYPAVPGDGTPSFVRDLAIEEAGRFETLVITPRVPGSPPTESSDGVRVVRFRYFPRRWEDLAHGAIIENLRARPSRWLQVVPLVLAEARAVRRAVREFRPDVVHAHWIIPQGVVATAVAGRVPRLVTTLGGDLYALNHPLLRRLKSWVLRRAGAVTVMNQEMAQEARTLGATDVRIYPMGADLETFRFAQQVERGTEDRLRLLFVGRLVEKKGLAVLLAALGRCTSRPSLTVVGGGPLQASLETQAAGHDVTFVGQLGRADLARAYAEHDLVVAPSVLAASGDQDGLPVVVLEAMGAGCGIVASDLPGIREAVADGESGLLVPAGDAAALAAAVDRLDADRSEVARLSRGAAARADEFSVRRAGERYTALLDEILAGVPDAGLARGPSDG